MHHFHQSNVFRLILGVLTWSGPWNVPTTLAIALLHNVHTSSVMLAQQTLIRVSVAVRWVSACQGLATPGLARELAHSLHSVGSYSHRAPSGVRYFVQYTINRPIYTSPHKSEVECVPRGVSKLCPYFEVVESIVYIGFTQFHGFLVLSNQPKIVLTYRVGWVKQ